ncbi:MAG: ATP-binding cassette domain-containing protein [Ruminococcaceae bacterium]|nr:ATP-binding cassette domain-containing protein [Oscillospiraceae bacterium]
MLEVVNLSKIYKSKGGAEVKALDNVSIRFPERGMVFLLGKSGSGKSTLLNVCGGLDAPTSGEILVKGRSSKNFSQGDFDSYRNTFIGFVFQEYNILNEFSVEDNIALALELQGKPKSQKAINELLEQVDLVGLSKRKPNTLSGGQKQRIAIARALIKSPEIIMADEPTGALDSSTGKAVFETLKKLSKDKLVLVVSHDRDFAEQYGDRIIELKDGKILSDVSKTNIQKTEVSENVSIIGSTICVKKGSALSDSEFDTIKGILRNSDSDIVISNDEKDVKAFKEATRISDSGEKEVFASTDEEKIIKKQYSANDSKFIKSRLPLRHAIKIGTSSLKTKPVRLFFTILLCVVAFTMLGLLSTMMLYDSDDTFVQTLKDSDTKYVRMEQRFQYDYLTYRYGELEWSDVQYQSGPISEALMSEIREKYKGAFGAAYFSSSFNVSDRSKYYSNYIKYASCYDESIDVSIITGHAPTSDNEIMISSYIADAMINCKLQDINGVKVEADSYEKLLGSKFAIHQTVEIVGVFDSGTIDPKYDTLKSGSGDSYSLEYDFDEYLSDGIYQLVFLSKNNLETISANRDYYMPSLDDAANCGYVFTKNGDKDVNNYEIENIGAKYKDISKIDINDTVYINGKNGISDNEVVVSFYTYVRTIYSELDKYTQMKQGELDMEYQKRESVISRLNNSEPINDLYISDYTWYWQEYNSPYIDEASKAEYEKYIPTKDNEFSGLLPAYLELKEAYDNYNKVVLERDKVNEYWNAYYELENGYLYLEDGTIIPLTDSQKQERLNKLYEVVSPQNIEICIAVSDNSLWEIMDGTKRIFTVAGYTGLSQQSYETNFYVTSATWASLWDTQKNTTEYYSTSSTKFKINRNDPYSVAIIPFDGSDAMANNLLDVYSNKDFDENDSRLVLNGSLLYGLEFADEMVSSLSKVFLWGGIIVAVFAALLLSNFISMSINNKKREIGILRAVGARGSDVFKIFFSESFVITLICMIVSTALSIVLCIVLNKNIAPTLGASIFNFGIPSFVMIVAVALITAIVATFLPVRKAARKKPVETIRAL